jgi:hypothetical protein
MKLLRQPVLFRAALLAAMAACSAAYATAQVPAPVVSAAVDTAVPIIVGVIKPHKVAQPKFEGTVVNATVAQITVRAKGNDMAIQTFPLSEAASAKMLEIINKGGYQYGDKVTVFYDPESKKALKFKGKPSKAS